MEKLDYNHSSVHYLANLSACMIIRYTIGIIYYPVDIDTSEKVTEKVDTMVRSPKLK